MMTRLTLMHMAVMGPPLPRLRAAPGGVRAAPGRGNARALAPAKRITV